MKPRRRRFGLNPEAITAERFDQTALETGLLWTDDYSDLFRCAQRFGPPTPRPDPFGRRVSAGGWASPPQRGETHPVRFEFAADFKEIASSDGCAPAHPPSCLPHSLRRSPCRIQ